MKLQTERLELSLLDCHALKWWIEDMETLETKLNCSYRAEPLTGFFLDIVKGQLQKTEKDPQNTVWHSFFLLIRKSDRAVVGSADFKDVPDAEGQVEIGYGLGKAFEHNGYMTEAVRAMCDFALSHNSVTSVIAETEKDGYASQRILERCGFVQYKLEETVWWRLKPQ